MSDLIPDYRNYDDEYERYLSKLVPGSFNKDITMNEAKEYLYNNVITTNLIQYTLQYIKSQIRRNSKVEVNLITDINKLDDIRQTSSNYIIGVTVSEDVISAFLWDTNKQECILIGENPQLKKKFTDQNLIRINVQSKDIISVIAGIFIRAINHANFKLNFNECQNQSLMKWVLLKQYRLKQMKDQGESFSRILDDQFLKEVNASKQSKVKSNSKQLSQMEISQKQDSISQQQKSNSQNYKNSFYSQREGQNQISKSHVSLPSTSRIDTLKDQISIKDFVQGMENIKSQILFDVPQPDELNPKDYTLKPIIPFFSPDKVFRVKVDDLEDLLKEQVKNKRIQEPNPADQLQQLLTYYSQNNPEQYKILLNQYSDFIHERMFEGMGLPSSTKQQFQMQPEFLQQQQQQQRQSIQFPKSKSTLFSQQPQLRPQLYQEEIVAIKFDRKINKQEFELLKQKLVLSQNIMEFYFNQLQEEFKRIFIFPIEFYNVLSQNPQKAQSFTDQYQGRNRTIFDLFDKVFVPVKISQYEYVGIYIDFQNKTIQQRIDFMKKQIGKQPPYKELVDQPVMHFIMKFIENEYNLKVMRAFNIFNWKFVEFMNEYAQNFNYSGLVLTYVIDCICNHRSAVGDNQMLKEFAQKILDTIRRAGSKK